MKYTLTEETAGYIDALRLLTQAKEQAFATAVSIYGEDQHITADFDQAIETAMDELAKLFRLNAMINLGFRDNHQGNTTRI